MHHGLQRLSAPARCGIPPTGAFIRVAQHCTSPVSAVLEMQVATQQRYSCSRHLGVDLPAQVAKRVADKAQLIEIKLVQALHVL